jgi:RimJ/RimL family protein N-acetyltransferase/L-amino acid N-acyltransferase YncA
MAALYALALDEPQTEAELKAEYDARRERIFHASVAEGEGGVFLGYNWASRMRLRPEDAYFYVIVQPEWRCRGAGGLLYADVEAAARSQEIRKLQTYVPDDCPECRGFVERRGFQETLHQVAMGFDLSALDEGPANAHVERLRRAGFRFTTMEKLRNTEEAQRRLYVLNNTAASETPGSDGSHPWESFEDFQKSVCGADWYDPAGQFVVIDTLTGEWAAMSAITRFKGQEFAYNLFTGVDRRYRGRKLAQAVKGLALQYARDVLKASTVRTHHNALNEPMIAIDRKFGYTLMRGTYWMDKVLAQART